MDGVVYVVLYTGMFIGVFTVAIVSYEGPSINYATPKLAIFVLGPMVRHYALLYGFHTLPDHWSTV